MTRGRTDGDGSVLGAPSRYPDGADEVGQVIEVILDRVASLVNDGVTGTKLRGEDTLRLTSVVSESHDDRTRESVVTKGDNREVLEDFEPLLELSAARRRNDQRTIDGIVGEISKELNDELQLLAEAKVQRWATATRVQYLYDGTPSRAYVEAKLLYRDGFYTATIMMCRSIAEMICYDRLDGRSHSFGSREEVERKSFRALLRWLRDNDPAISQAVFDRLNSLYDLGNNYVHPKAGYDAKSDSLKALDMIGESVFDVYGVKGSADLVGRKVRSAYLDLPDVCSGANFMLTAFTSVGAAVAHPARHHERKAPRAPARKQTAKKPRTRRS
jgi:hypothetical protein